MLLTFWVHGRGRDEPESLGWAKSAWDSVESWGREAGRWTGLVRYGEGSEAMRISENREPVQAAEGSRPGLVGRLFGSLTGLRTSEGSGGKSKATTRGLPAPGTYKIGEVRGEYVKVCKIASLDRLLSLTGGSECSRTIHPIVIGHRCPFCECTVSRSSSDILESRSRRRGLAW